MSSTLVIENAPVALRLPALHKKEKVFYPETDGKPMAETDPHRDQMVDIIETLKRRFAQQADIYVTGNIMFYYVKGDRYKFISPDVMVVKGVAKRKRRIFRLWDEYPPCVVFEISSDGTKSQDFKKKFRLYAQFGVPEYYVFDPEQMKPDKAWTAFRLVNGEYQRVAIEYGRIFSPELGLEIVQVGQTLRFFDPVKQKFLLANDEVGTVEAALERSEAALARSEAARQQERQQAEAALERSEAARQQERQQTAMLLAQNEEKIAQLLAKLEKQDGG